MYLFKTMLQKLYTSYWICKGKYFLLFVLPFNMKKVLTVIVCFKIKNGKKRPGELSYNAIFLYVYRFASYLYCCKCVFRLSAVSPKKSFVTCYNILSLNTSSMYIISVKTFVYTNYFKLLNCKLKVLPFNTVSYIV